ncbi:THO complex subunit 4A-like [Impatiens glandulifera]|uniref:THO complex subunit 4A-like n=1 Tax=Impatiens glandulifera TaxID=253017 RepID=UPI001FB14CB2|nr:THO complex subunit 4A-like [Impatiens glandulifera]
MSGAAALDMSLDDLIKVNKKPSGGGASRGGGGGSGRGRSSGPGPVRRFSNRGGNRAAPYSTSQAPDSTWRHDMFTSDQTVAHPAQQAGARPSSIETGTKLYISNLDYGVSNEDIKELLSEVGDLKRYGIHYDRSGRSKGTAEVVFSRRQDALAAVKRYNNVQLDGKPMKVEIVGTNIVTPSVAPPPAVATGIIGNPNGSSRSGHGRNGGGGGGPTRNHGGGRGFGRGRGGGGGGRGGHGGGGRGRGRGEKLSAEDLDKDLDMYYAKAADAAPETMEEAN